MGNNEEGRLRFTARCSFCGVEHKLVVTVKNSAVKVETEGQTMDLFEGVQSLSNSVANGSSTTSADGGRFAEGHPNGPSDDQASNGD